MSDALVEIAVIGGSGFYAFGDGRRQIQVNTPYGAPSAPVTVGEVGGRRVAFLPRHGVAHEYPPHRVNYRANLWALWSLGPDTFLDGPQVGHVSFADPYCPELRRVLTASARTVADAPVHDHGTVVVIGGPRFSPGPSPTGSVPPAGRWST